MLYISYTFEFDPRKDKHNKEKHGVCLSEAAKIWEGDHIIIPAKNISDEQRHMILGIIEEETYACIFTYRGNKIRLISCHRTDKKLERYYHERSNKKILAKEFDKKFDKDEDLSNYLDFGKAVVIKRINLDLPQWILDVLDKEALKLNVSRQAVIKMWLSEKISNIKKAA